MAGWWAANLKRNRQSGGLRSFDGFSVSFHDSAVVSPHATRTPKRPQRFAPNAPAEVINETLCSTALLFLSRFWMTLQPFGLLNFVFADLSMCCCHIFLFLFYFEFFFFFFFFFLGFFFHYNLLSMHVPNNFVNFLWFIVILW